MFSCTLQKYLSLWLSSKLLNNGSRNDYSVYANLTNLSYFRKKEGERGKERKRKRIKEEGRKILLKVFDFCS